MPFSVAAGGCLQKTLVTFKEPCHHINILPVKTDIIYCIITCRVVTVIKCLAEFYLGPASVCEQVRAGSSPAGRRC